jgi:choline dehydrogenase-like flavoprotein
MTSTPDTHYDVIVVGSGPGGATVARDLARQGRRVLILERGDNAPLRGSLLHMAAIGAIPGRGAFINRDFSLLVQGITTGGSSAINFATAMAPPQDMFSRYGIDLQAALAAIKLEVPLAPLPDNLVGPMAARIAHSATALGLAWHKLDKMIYTDQCRTGCWRCLYGCPYRAKWTARNFIDDAIEYGAELQTGALVHRVLQANAVATGVTYTQNGQAKQAFARTIILAGGGIASPRLLQASGVVTAKASHFSDPVIAVMGSIAEGHGDGGAEVPMVAGMHLESEGIMLADLALPLGMYRALTAQVGRFDRWFSHHRTMSIMVKIRDEMGGEIGAHWVNKSLQASDRAKLLRGVDIARDILRHAGAGHIFKTWHFAAHPGGSVRIGEGVNAQLETALKNLYVCDASVIPEAWGLPPTLSLMCLAKRLALHLQDASTNR